jgi:hypothetical protein
MTDFVTTQTSATTQAIGESPFIEANGLFFYKQECKSPQFLNSSFVRIQVLEKSLKSLSYKCL